MSQRADLLATNSLHFCLCGNVLISPSFFKKQFCQIYSSWLRGFPSLNMSFHCLLASMVLMRNQMLIFLTIFFTWAFCCFQDSSSLAFDCLIISVDLFEFFQLGVHRASWRCSFMSLIKFGKSLFLQTFFLSLSLSLYSPLGGSHYLYVSMLDDITEVFQDALIFNSCFFMLLRLNNCNWSIFTSTNSFPAYSNLLLNSSSEFFIPIIIFFNFGTFI